MRRECCITLVCLLVLSAALPGRALELPDGFRLEPVVSGLTTPSAMAVTPDGRILIAERTTGDLRQIRGGELDPVPLCHVDVASSGAAGLLGVAVHPAFMSNGWIYLYYTELASGTNSVVRLDAFAPGCGTPATIAGGLGSGAGFLRNGGGLAFGADGMLYVGTGDAGLPSNGQADGVREGKILRLEPDGTIPADNPTSGDPVYAKGVRDARAVSVSGGGQVYAIDAGAVSDGSVDELNAVPVAGNLGWDNFSGDSGGILDDPLLVRDPVTGVRSLAIYATGAFPDAAADGLDNDADRYGADGLPGVAHTDDNGAGVCLGSVNFEQPCTSDSDCPDRSGENARCYFQDDAAEYCPGGSANGDDACGAAGTDEPDESYAGNLFLVGSGETILRAVPDPGSGAALAGEEVFFDATFLPDCPGDLSAIATGNDGLLYLAASNGGGNAGGLYRVVYDRKPGPREVSGPGSHFPLMVGKGGTPDEVVLSWEDLRDDAKQPRDNGTDPLAPRREFTLWQGTIGSWSGHAPVPGHDQAAGVAVNDALRRETIVAGSGDSYFLVSARSDNLEGTLGLASDLSERSGYAVTDLCETIGYHEGTAALPSSGWEYFTCGRDFTLLDEFGRTFNLSDLRGQVVLMDFAADWCLPCESQADQLENFYQQYRGHGLRPLTVMMDEENVNVDWVGRPSISECLDWGDRPSAPDHTFLCVADPTVDTGQPFGGQQAWPRFDRTGFLPTNVVIDQGMRVVYNDGGFDSVTIADRIERLLGRFDRCLH